MLRINLLPIRQLKKRAKARNQIIGFGMVFCAVLLALAFVGLLQVASIKNVEAAIAELEREQKTYAAIAAEVDRLEQQKKDLQNKIAIIKKLRRESSLTVHVMDETARLLDNNRMWLTTFSQQGGVLDLNGVALDNQTVAQFMESLKESEYVRDVKLNSSALSKVANRSFQSFAISCSVDFPQEEAPENVAQK